MILGIYLFLISHFRLNYNCFDTYILDYNLVNANEINNDKEKNILNNKVTKEATHILIVEIIKYIFVSLVAIVLFFYVFLRKKFEKIKKHINFKRYFVNKLIEQRIKTAYEDGNKESLQKQLLDNALASARLNDPQKKLTGIQQLSQFAEDKALFGLIDILANEHDTPFVYCIINALNEMIKRRSKNNEI